MNYLIFLLAAYLMPGLGAQSDNLTLHPFSREGGWGFLNKRGEEIVPPIYDAVHAFQEGLAAVELYDEPANSGRVLSNGKTGYVDRTGQLVIPLRYGINDYSSRNFSEGLAAVKRGGKFGYINREGMLVIPPAYTRAHSFKDGVALVEDSDKSLRVIGRDGAVIFSPFEVVRAAVGPDIKTVDAQRRYFSEGKLGLRVYHEGVAKTVVVDTAGRVVTVLDSMLVLHEFSQGFAAAKRDFSGGYSFVDERGRVRLPFEYKTVSAFQNGCSVVRPTGSAKAGIIDTNFVLVVDTIYDQIFEASENGIFLARKGSQYGYINARGAVVIDFIYDAGLPFSEGLALVQRPDGRLVCLDTSGTVRFYFSADREAYWAQAHGFRNGLVVIRFGDTKSTRYVNIHGEEVADFD